MKVAIVAQQMRQPVPGGIGTYINGLVHGLRSGHHDDLHVSFVASSAPGRTDPLASWGDVQASRWGRRALAALWDRELIRPDPVADVLHATSLVFPSLPRESAAVATMFVHDVAWRTHPEFYPERGRAFHERALTRAIASQAALLVPSTATADALMWAGVEAARITVVGEGCDHLPLVPRRGDGTYLLAVSTREPRKNLPRLVEAYARIRMELPEPWPLYIVGPKGWDDRSGRSALVDTGQPGVELLGAVSDERLAELLAGARTFVYVPLSEGFGLPPAEAMRAGVPVVASPVPSISADVACIVDPLDTDDIARGLLATSTDEGARKALVSGGLEACRNLTWRASADAHVDVWTSLLDRR